MSSMVSQIAGVSIVCSTVCSGADIRKYQSSASLAFVRGIHRWPVDSLHKGPVTRRKFPFDDVIIVPRNMTKFNTMRKRKGVDITGLRSVQVERGEAALNI